MPPDDLAHAYQQLAATLRPKARATALAKLKPEESPVERLKMALTVWGAFNRSWIDRLVPVAPPVEDAVSATAKPSRTSKITKKMPLKVFWEEHAEEIVERGEAMIGVNSLPYGVHGLIGEVYVI